MKKIGLFVCLAFALVAIAGCGSGKGKVLVNINGTKFTEGDLEFLGTINPRIQAQMQSPEGKKRLLDNVVEQELLYQKAIKEGINRKADVKAKVDLYRRVIIAQSLVDDEIEKAAKKYYDEHADEFKKLKFSHIMVKYANPDDVKKASEKKKGPKETVRSEADALKLANTIKARLDKGEDFAAVAKETSEDLTTKNRGGDLGAVAKDEKRFEGKGWAPLTDKAFEMKVGEIAGPIKTNQGYHIITVTQGIEVEPFEEAKNAIIFKIRNDTRNELLAELKKDATIKYPEEEKAVAEKKEEPKVPAEAGKIEVNAAPAAPAAGEKPVTIAPPIMKKPEAAPKQIAKETPKAKEKPASAVKKDAANKAPEKKE